MGVSFSFVEFREIVRLDEIMKYIHSNPTMLVFDEYGTLCYKDSGEPFFEDV